MDEPAPVLQFPDFLLIDLDPVDCPYSKIVEAALLGATPELDLAGLEGYPKTTGGDGLHIYVPLEPRYTYEQVRGFAELLATTLAAVERPELSHHSTRSFETGERPGLFRLGADRGREDNLGSVTFLAAYPGAPVATPLAWRELTPRLHPNQFTIANAFARFDQVGDCSNQC